MFYVLLNQVDSNASSSPSTFSLSHLYAYPAQVGGVHSSIALIAADPQSKLSCNEWSEGPSTTTRRAALAGGMNPAFMPFVIRERRGVKYERTLMTITAVGCIGQWKVDEEYGRGERTFCVDT